MNRLVAETPRIRLREPQWYLSGPCFSKNGSTVEL